MATYKELQDRINLDYLNQMTLIPEVKRAIAVAIRTYEAGRYWFNEAATAVATVASQSYITVPSDFLSPDRLEITVNGSTNEIPRRSFSQVRLWTMNAPIGQPLVYTYRGDRLELSQIPDNVYNGTLYYVQSLPTLSADTDSNAWTNEASDVIAHAACVELMTSVLQTDDRKIARHQLMLRNALDTLATRNETRLFTKLRSTKF